MGAVVVTTSVLHGLEAARVLVVLVCSRLSAVVAMLPELWREARCLVVVVGERRLETTVLEVARAVCEGATYLAAAVLGLEREVLGRPLLRTVCLLMVLVGQRRLVVEVDALRVLLGRTEGACVAPTLLRFLLVRLLITLLARGAAFE